MFSKFECSSSIKFIFKKFDYKCINKNNQSILNWWWYLQLRELLDEHHLFSNWGQYESSDLFC